MTDDPSNAMSLTLSEAAERIAYCYECKKCGFQERVDLKHVAQEYPSSTVVRDLLTRIPCSKCRDTKKIVMTLWLNATTTERMLAEHGYPVWESDRQ